MVPVGSVMVKASTLVFGLALTALAVFSFLMPFDARQLVTGDALYPVQMVQHWPLDYRPPPPNRVIPDVAVHWFASAAITDPLNQKIIAGISLFAATLALIGMFKGAMVLAITVLIMLLADYEYMNSAFHYTLPLLVLATQLTGQNRILQAMVIFASVFSDLLVTIPLAILLVDSRQMERSLERLLAVAAGLLAAAFYSDLGVSFVQLGAVLPVWVVVVMVAERAGLKTALAVAACAGLVAGTVTGLVPARYAVPIAVGLLIVLTPVTRWHFSWTYAGVPAVISMLFVLSADIAAARQTSQSFLCLSRELAARQIKVVATDHWTAKPLALADRIAGGELMITQTDFAENDIHAWMAPYSFYGKQTVYSVRDPRFCKKLFEDATYCGQAKAAPVESSERVCGGFELYRYARPIPIHHAVAPAGKLDAFSRHLATYLRKAIGRTSGQ